MSKGEKVPLAQAAGVADKVAGSLAEYCHQIVVAGSIRRKVSMVGDIELVAVPHVETQTDLLGEAGVSTVPLLTHLDKLLKEQKIVHTFPQAWGEKQRKFVVTTLKGRKYQVDLYMCEANRFGSILMIRTGSKDFSKWMVTKRDKGGAMPENMKQDDGHLWRFVGGDWVPVDTYEEIDYFNQIQLPWIPPEERHHNKWHEWLAETNRWLEAAGGVMTWPEKEDVNHGTN